MQSQNYNNNYYGNAGRTDLYQPHQPAHGAAPAPYYAPTHYSTNNSGFDLPPSYATIYPPSEDAPTKPTFFGTTRIGNVD